VPELPEVEVVRRGLERWVVGRTVSSVDVYGGRALRRFPGNAAQFVGQLTGRSVQSAERRGKFLWLPLSEDEALAVHLGMSGQLLVGDEPADPQPHLRVRIRFTDGGPDLRFVDQRTFGWMSIEELVPGAAGRLVAAPAARIAVDPLESDFDGAATARAMRRSQRPIKAALLDQNVVSGIGNIYADEALWLRRRHWATPCSRLRQQEAVDLLGAAAKVMTAALTESDATGRECSETHVPGSG